MNIELFKIAGAVRLILFPPLFDSGCSCPLFQEVAWDLSTLIPGSFTVVTVAVLTVLQMQPLQRIKIADSCPSLRALSHLASLLLQTSGSLPELSKL